MKPKLVIEQKITAFANKYTIFEAQANGKKGQLLALAQQKRFAIKEKVEFFKDETKKELVFSFRAEKVIDIHGQYIVEDSQGNTLGVFKKNFSQSLVKSTWHILDANGNPRINLTESNQVLAVLRRFGGFIPLVGGVSEIVTAFFRYHFDIIDVSKGEVIGRYQKTKLIRDHYSLSMSDEAFNNEDWRVLASVAVALDALQSR